MWQLVPGSGKAVMMWHEDGKGLRDSPPHGYTKLSALTPQDRERVVSYLELIDPPIDTTAVSTFHVCEMKGRDRYRRLLTSESTGASTQFHDLFKAQYEVGERTGDEAYDEKLKFIRARYKALNEDESHHDIVPLPDDEALEVWMTSGGRGKEPLAASEVIFQAFRSVVPSKRLRRFTHRNVLSGSATGVYAFLSSADYFTTTNVRVPAPTSADDRSDAANIFFAYLGTDNGSTAFGLLLDHRHDLGVTGLTEIVADGERITFHFG